MEVEPHIKATINRIPASEREALLEAMLEKFIQYFGSATTGIWFPQIAEHYQEPMRNWNPE